MKLKKVAALGLATAMAFSVTACSSSKTAETTAAAEDAETTAAADGEAVKEAVEGKDPAEVKVGISIYQFADNFMTLYRNELQNYLVNELGLKAENISIMDGKNDQSEQMNQIRNFVTQGFDVMIVNLVQASSEPDVTNICNEAGIPVVYINREPDAEREEAWVTDGIKATYVGADARQSGTYQGEEIAELENKGDADGDGVPYQPGDIYQILWHINDIATSEHGVRRYNRGYVPNSEGDTDGNGVIDTCDLFDIVYECALRGAGLK